MAMPPSHLEHDPIQSADLQATRDWRMRVLSMSEAPHLDLGVTVYWRSGPPASPR
jgi:hypothetical protein